MHTSHMEKHFEASDTVRDVVGASLVEVLYGDAAQEFARAERFGIRAERPIPSWNAAMTTRPTKSGSIR